LLYERGMPGGYECGIPELDAHITLRIPGLTTITGAPGAGKTVWLDWYLVRQAQHNGLRIALCSTEMVPPERHVALLISQYLDKPFAAFEKDRMTLSEMQGARKWVGNRFYFVLPEENTVDSILERARVLKERHNIDILVVDPFNDIFSTRNREQTNTDWIHGVLSQFTHAAMDLGLHVIIVAHPKKLQKKTDGTYFVPTMYDIAESAAFANRSTNGIALWRDTTLPENECITQAHIQKIKFHEDGEVGVVQFAHRKATGSYWPIERPNQLKVRLTYNKEELF
jgi:twinkle protein